MYYEERLINGRWYYRYHPESEFKPFSIEKYVEKIKRLEAYINKLKAEVKE